MTDHMTDYGKTKSALARHGLAPTKRLGQNFLVNPKTAETIVGLAGFQAEDMVVEVGVGLGALTIPLARQVAEVIGIEIDSGIIRYHKNEKNLPENVTLIHGDILKTDFTELNERSGNRLKILANLPYSISNPFIFKLIENKSLVDHATVMLQKEVADRLTAVPGTKEYGIPTVLLAGCAKIEKLLRLKAAEFHPRPKIDSILVRITFPHNQAETCTYSALQKIVRTAFSSRRKTLLNNLASPAIFNAKSIVNRSDRKQLAEKIILAAGLSPGIRAESLTLEHFQCLALKYEEFLQDYPIS